MKNAALLELLISSTIGAYCLVRAIGVMPAAIEQAKQILLLGAERTRRIEEMLETESE